MIIVRHKFLDKKVNEETQILIIGTFNPYVSNNPADYFYGRSRNYMWKLLPTSFGEEDLKGKAKVQKIEFVKKRSIDFIDLIKKVKIDDGNETNYNDRYLDNKIIEWFDVRSEILTLSKLTKVCFTRKSLTDIPNMKSKIIEIENLCRELGLEFKYLTTPARFYNFTKQEEWTKFFLG